MQRTPRTLLVFVAVLLATIVPAGAHAAKGECGQPFSAGEEPTTADCLYTLRAAVSLETCRPSCICDTNGDHGVSASDALFCLRFVVGAETSLGCDCPVGPSTTTLVSTTTAPLSTSTLPTTTTTIFTTTTTLGPTAACPVRMRIQALAAAGAECATNSECASALCDDALERCVSETELDLGWSGEGHDSDLDSFALTTTLDCPGGAPACGACTILGVADNTRACRCESDHRRVCDAPFGLDSDDCAGGLCICYLGPPLPLLAGNTPMCIVQRLATDVAGTIDPDSGDVALDLDLRLDVHLGELLLAPCPSCGGRCTEPEEKINTACLTNADCNTNGSNGLCEGYDTVAGDGVREGLCVGGPDEGFACDIHGSNTTFPANVDGPSGAAMSLDCFPTAGKVISGEGLHIQLTATTGAQTLEANLPCGFPVAPRSCPCGVCSDGMNGACSSNADCSAPATCGRPTGASVFPNACTDETCAAENGGEGTCAGGPVDQFCEQPVRPDGRGLVRCMTNTDCDAYMGLDGGLCSIAQNRECFMPTLESSGVADPERPVAAGLYCVAATSNPGVNFAYGLPGPARTRIHSALAGFCNAGETRQYVPGVGCQ